MESSDFKSLRPETKNAILCEDRDQHHSLSLSDLHDEIMLELHGEKVDRSSNIQEVHVEPWPRLRQKKIPEFSPKSRIYSGAFTIQSAITSLKNWPSSKVDLMFGTAAWVTISG